MEVHTLSGPETVLVHLLPLERAVYVWLGAASGAPSSAAEFGAACAAVPPRRRGEEPAASNLLGDSSPLEDVAGRLSARLGKLVLLASALGASEGSSVGAGDTAWLEAALLQLLASRAGAGGGGGSGGAAASGSGTAAGGAS
jgi:hypothetical protein